MIKKYLNIKVTKLIISIGILICMFIPISQCSYTPQPIDLDSQTKAAPDFKIKSKTSVNIVAEDIADMGVLDYWIPLTFILPLFFCIPFHKKRRRFVILQSIQSLYAIWLLYFVFIAVYYYYDPLFGGYIFTLLALCFGIVTVLEWIKYYGNAREF